MATATSNGKHWGHVTGIRLNGTHPKTIDEPRPAEPWAPAPAANELEPHPAFAARVYRPTARLAGKVAIITGADSGIGRAVALAYAREGADVAILYCGNDADARETQRGVEDAGRRALMIEGDVSDETFCQRAVKQVVAELGQLDILVSNAAVRLRTDDVQTLTREQLERSFRINVFGYFFMVQACLPFLRAGSAIIATGSDAGIFGSHRLLDFSATQGAVHAFTRSLAQQLLPKGIRVNAVAPGPVASTASGTEPDLRSEGTDERAMMSGSGRPVQPEEVAPAYVFFASNADSSCITGQVLAELGSVLR
jgi:NAD(P)-dependent dehydrogenase (short-subunit alcohol dehydrogenase family)